MISTLDLLTLHAKAYSTHGFNTAPTRQDKRPVVAKWAYLQSAAVPWQVGDGKPDILSTYNTDYAKEHAVGLAVICGAGSGNLEVIDVDCKYDLTGTLFEDLMQTIIDHDEALASKLLIAKTQNGGYHLYYRCETIEGNKKLAHRETTPDERETTYLLTFEKLTAAGDIDAADKAGKARDNDKYRDLIETRGQGGYVLGPPTAGYEFIQSTPADCPTITMDERAALLNICRSFTQVIAAPDKPAKMAKQEWDGSAAADNPFEDYNMRGVDHMLSLLESHGWSRKPEKKGKVIFLRPGNTTGVPSGDFDRGRNLFMVFTTSSEFTSQKGYLPASVFKLLECANDDKDAAKRLLDMGYGKRKERQELTSVNDAIKAERDSAILTFWEVIHHKKTTETKIDRKNFLLFLQKAGFGLYRYDPTRVNYILIRNEGGIISEISSQHIRKYTMDYIQSLPEFFDGITRHELENVFLASEGVMKPGHLEHLAPVHPDFLKDTPDCAYYPFANGIVCVTTEGSTIRQLRDLGKCIWASQVKPRTIKLVDDIEPEGIEFYQFLSKICAEDPARIMHCMGIIGYMLHGYKRASNSFCVIMCEETETKGGIGGTGKGILYKGLGHLVPWVFLNGKNAKLDGQFLFDQVEPDTKLIVVDDARKNTDFEGYFTIITEGILVEQKYKGKIFIPFADAPKLIFTTNYVIDAASSAAKRRQRTIEFARFFHHGYTPKQHFGHELFADWCDNEWNAFYNLLFACVQQYLTVGVPDRPASLSIQRRAISEKYGDNFLEFWDDYLQNDSKDWKLLSELHSEYLTLEGIDIKFCSAKKFRNGIEAAAGLSGAVIIERKNAAQGGKRQIKIQDNINEPIEDVKEVESTLF